LSDLLHEKYFKVKTKATLFYRAAFDCFENQKNLQQPKQAKQFLNFLVLREKLSRKFFGNNLKLTKPLSRLTSTTCEL